MPLSRREFLLWSSCALGPSLLTGCIALQPRIGAGNNSAPRSQPSRDDIRRIFEQFDANRVAGVDISAATRKQQNLYDALTQGIGRYRESSQGRPPYFFEDMTSEVTEPLIQMIRHTRTVENAIQSYGKGGFSRQDGAYVIPAGGMLTYTQKGFCMDPQKPAPNKGDALTLVPATDRIRPRLMPLYQALGRWSATQKDTHRVQSLTWMLMSAGRENVYAIEQMSQNNRRDWNSIMPGGADLLIREHRAAASSKRAVKALSKSLGLDKLLPPALLNQILSPQGASLHLDELIRQGERMTGGKGTGYSALAQGVYARGTGSDALTGTYSILNTSDRPFVFDPTQYMAKPSSEKQFVSGTGLMTNIATKLGLIPSPKEAAVLSEMTIAGMTDVSKFLAESAWQGAWQSLYKKTPASTNVAKRLSGIGKNLGGAATALPVIGNAISIYEAIAGRDAFTGEELGALERGLSIIGTVPGLQTARTMAKAIDSPAVRNLLRNSEPLFALQTKTENLRSLAAFTVGDFANEVGLPLAVFNESTKKSMKDYIIDIDLPWNRPTQSFIDGVKSGGIKW